MKKIFTSILSLLALLSTNAAVIIVDGTNPINTNTTWTSNNIYVLVGEVVVKNATLTIEPGTVIKGDYNVLSRLVITTSGKIVAQGTADKPIIFTSNRPAGQRQRGDWGGILVAGKAPLNVYNPQGQAIQKIFECGTAPDYSYGGNDPDDSSGVISYVRIEYAGYICGANTELNSLSLGGVGRKTKIDHVMVSYALDDAFEIWGGTVNLSHIVTYSTRDDDFDTDNGWSGFAQFGLIVKEDSVADEGDPSNGFESDNDDQSSYSQPYTSGVISNFTCVGPAKTTTSVIASNHGWAARIRRNSAQSLFNSIFIGYKQGIRFEGVGTQNKFTNDTIEFANNIVAGSVEKNWVSSVDSQVLYNSKNSNRIYGGNANDYVKLVEPFDIDNFNFQPESSSPALTGSSFSNDGAGNSKLKDWFKRVNYVGAFDNNDNWLAGWANFKPQFETYSSIENPTLALSYLTVFPNPAVNKLCVSITSNEEKNISIEIIDAKGSVVLNTSKTLTPATNIVHLDVNGFSNGLYIVRVLAEGLALTQKVNISK
jgi:hypothetical protein